MEGLAVTEALGLPIPVIPHWNNAEGGNHDTSRCYIGQRRLAKLTAELDNGLLGVDEHTAMTVDLDQQCVTASGIGSVTVHSAVDTVIASGESVALDTVRSLLGAAPQSDPVPIQGAAPDLRTALEQRNADAVAAALLDAEESVAEGKLDRAELRGMLVEIVEVARTGMADPRDAVAPLVTALLDLRAEARGAGRYDEADGIRKRLLEAGVDVRDTPSGPEWDLQG